MWREGGCGLALISDLPTLILCFEPCCSKPQRIAATSSE